jgi:hypothetical protein
MMNAVSITWPSRSGYKAQVTAAAASPGPSWLPRLLSSFASAAAAAAGGWTKPRSLGAAPLSQQLHLSIPHHAHKSCCCHYSRFRRAACVLMNALATDRQLLVVALHSSPLGVSSGHRVSL